MRSLILTNVGIFALFAFSVLGNSIGASVEARSDSYAHPLGGALESLSGAISTLPSRTIQVPRTNAERFAAGLPPLPPSRRNRRTGARRQEPSPLPCTPVRGNILVKRADTGTIVGTVAQTNSLAANVYGIGATPLFVSLGITDTCIAPDVTVSFTGIDILAETTYAATWPYMGAVSGPNNGADNVLHDTNMAFIQSTSETPAGSPPVAVSNSFPGGRKSESAIWNFNPVTLEITAIWVQPDGSTINAPIVYLSAPGNNAFTLAGDAGQVASRYGGYSVTFTFVPIGGVPVPPINARSKMAKRTIQSYQISRS